jgi:histidine ammonia-lyase
MSERRTDRFLDKSRNGGLNAFLAADPGVDSGHMIAQYTQAGIVSELKRLAAPASVDSIPTSAMQEDHVSMGWSAARKLRRSIDGLQRVLAIELMTAARGIEMRGETPAPVSARVIAALRERVPGVGPDRYLAPDIAAAVDLVVDGALLRAAGWSRSGAPGDAYRDPGSDRSTGLDTASPTRPPSGGEGTSA